MGALPFLGRLLGRLPASSSKGAAGVPATDSEQRRGSGSVWAYFGAGPISGIGNFVNARLAENVASVVACVSAISGPISSVPARVYRSIPGGREEAPNHPVARLVRRPNSRQTWPDWMQFTLGQVLLHGNSISMIERDGSGRPVALIPIPWQSVQVQLLASGRVAFDITLQTFPWSTMGTPLRRLFEDEVFWLKDRSDDGFLGRSVLARAPAVLKAAIGIQTFTSTLWDNAATPSGVMKHPGKLTKEAADRISQSLVNAHGGAANAGKVMILEEGMEFASIAMTPEDSEVLASRRFTGEESCRLFGVPPPIAGDFQFGSFTNAETAGRWHSSLCLAQWCRKVEAEFQRSLFDDDGFHLLLDLSGLQRGDDSARWTTYALARQHNILTVDEIRALEGFNPMSQESGNAAGGELVPGDEAVPGGAA
jgi:HK97 family phage portal protein